MASLLRWKFSSHTVSFAFYLVICTTWLTGQTPVTGEVVQGSRPNVEMVVTRAINQLRTTGQAQDGSFSAQLGTGVTSLVTTAVLRNGRTVEDPLVKRSLAWLEDFVQPDGGIYRPGSLYRNYETCLAILCFQEANQNGRYDEFILAAQQFIQDIQWGPKNGTESSDTSYGGAGYGKHGRPDLSNTSFFVDAMIAAGNDDDCQAIQRALKFISRCQNLETEHNTSQFASKINDGSFYYTIAAGGKSQADKTPNGGLRGYGSMTYAGLKSMLYAGVGPDDPRVEAALNWIRLHYDLKSNPGLGNQGLYYYYHTFAKALDALGEDVFVDDQGVKHDWRLELAKELASRQREDGTWINEHARWFEGDTNLVTGYVLLTLAYCDRRSTLEDQ